MAALKKLKLAVYALSARLNFVGIILMLFMIAFTAVDVFGRIFLNKPLTGAYELVEFTMVIVIVFAMSYTQVKQGHMSVNTLVERLPRRVERLFIKFVNLIGGCIFLLIAWQTFIKANIEKVSGTTSSVLLIVKYPFVYIAFAGFLLLTVIFALQVLLPEEEGKQEDINSV
jgi:TRAP-type C4-dicarboxylate transport system permease small subunit